MSRISRRAEELRISNEKRAQKAANLFQGLLLSLTVLGAADMQFSFYRLSGGETSRDLNGQSTNQDFSNPPRNFSIPFGRAVLVAPISEKIP